ncbi:hypothetical protein [Azospirillum griseum]|uniref:Uncharacterized protein n=1 Tax=Azospirillum griseum TaxID=2496639 RepID=A0A3S0IH95_9PROT|nr:hypothetical protein [Azospirillum griseum]RTR22936.1 hypothetical protein EJ903_04995 [Azospirillum griseum]
MPVRRSQRTITFSKPFHLTGLDAVQPPGVYSVEIEEELIEGLSFPAYRRVSTVILLPGPPASGILMQAVAVSGAELEDAERLDALP